MNRNSETLPIRESTKSLQRFKTIPIEERVHIVSNDLLTSNRPSSRNKVSRVSMNKGKRSQEEMLGRIKSLEIELERKINQDGILRNFMKTLNSSDLSRIDMYLELRKCEEIIGPLQLRLAEQSEKSRSYMERIDTLEGLLQEKQKKYIENIVVLESQFDENYKSRDKELSNLKSKLEDMKESLQNSTFLLDEVKKKNESLMQDNKTLAQQHKSNERNHQKAVKQFELAKNQLISKIQELQQSNEQIMIEFEQTKMRNGVLKNKLEKLQKHRMELNENVMKLNEQIQQNNREINKFRYIIEQKQSQITELQQQLTKKQQIIMNLNERLTDSVQNYTNQIHLLDSQSKQLNMINQQLKGQIRQLEKERTTHEQCSKSDRSMIRQLKERQQALIKYYENQRQQMMAQLKRQRFHDDENESLRKRYQLQQEQKETIIEKLQSKIGDFIKENHFLTKRVEQLEKEMEKCRVNQKFNEKMYVENYKMAGRLLEIKKQILLVLNTDASGDPQELAEESLQKVFPSFLKTVYSLIIQCKSSGEKTESMKKHLTQRIKQLFNILHHFQSSVDIEGIDLLVQRYIGCLEPLGETDSKNSEAIGEAYHLLIQKLINGQRCKKLVTEPSINIVNDSLDNVIFKENQRESNDKSIFDKKYEQSIRQGSNSHAYSRSKESQSNKQNINSINEVPRMSKQKNPVGYNSIDRSNYPIQGNRRSSKSIRSEIQRKYFRS